MKRRIFSREQKLEMLKAAEAVGSSISKVAHENEIQPSQLFSWRKQFMEQEVSLPLVEKTNCDSVRSSLERINRLVALEQKIVIKIESDINSKTISAYNAATAFSAMVGTLMKLIEAQSFYMEKLRIMAASVSREVNQDPDVSPEMRDAAEQLLYQLVQNYAEYMNSPEYMQ